MEKTVRELIEMYENDTLKTDHTTQRGFLYNSTYVETEYGTITKAGWLITCMLEKNIKLPAIYFWQYPNDNDNYNLHDGKQRFLSIYEFIHGNVVTYINGEEKKFSDLDQSLKNKLLDYLFDIVVRIGSKEEEQDSFILINMSSMPLTEYEALRGAYYGSFINEFENYINNELTTTYNGIKPVGRGEQAIWLLKVYFNTIGSKKHDEYLNELKEKLSYARNSSFDKNKDNFSKIIDTYNNLIPSAGNNSDGKPEKMWRLARYIINGKVKGRIDILNKIMSYYDGSRNVPNDMKKWKFEVHKIAIDALIDNNVRCDYTRFFSDDVKRILWETSSHKCANCNHVYGYNELEVDHIIPWSNGGSTTRTNAQLLCKSCNASKGNR